MHKLSKSIFFLKASPAQLWRELSEKMKLDGILGELIKLLVNNVH